MAIYYHVQSSVRYAQPGVCRLGFHRFRDGLGHLQALPQTKHPAAATEGHRAESEEGTIMTGGAATPRLAR